MAGGSTRRKRKAQGSVGQRKQKNKKVEKKEEDKVEEEEQEQQVVEEKRLGPSGRTVKWAKKPNEMIRDRIERAMPGSGHRMFLIDRSRIKAIGSDGGGEEHFDVLGATANVYTVTVSRHPHCTCPDFLRRRIPCKHIMFVLLRVLKVNEEDPLLWQKALLSSEVDKILGESENKSADADVLASQRVKNAFHRIKSPGKVVDEDDDSSTNEKALSLEGKDCGICFELFEEGKKEELVSCKECGNHLHKTCFQKWASAKIRSHQAVTCVYCRAIWHDQEIQVQKKGSYINLASVSAQHS